MKKPLLEQSDKSRGQRFEELVAAVFLAQKFDVRRDVQYPVGTLTRRVDLVLTWNGNVVTVVEVKHYRSRARYLPDAEQVIAQVLNAQAAFKADHAIIVTNLYRDRMAPAALFKRNIVLIGIDDLAQLAVDPGLREAIGLMDEELSSALRDFDSTGLAPPSKPFDPTILHMRARAPSLVPPVSTKGNGLKADLAAITAGKSQKITLPSGYSGANWRLFEDKCYEALQYIFEGIFGNWDTQKPVAGDDNRFDAIAKIQGSDVFCRTLIEHYNCRHILFEFKNYENPIGPNLIHITEKYLFPKALRGVAVIISPKGFSEAAERAAHGALRDVGKIMLSVDTTLLCRLLDEKDKAQPPAEEMENLLDAFLLKVGR